MPNYIITVTQTDIFEVEVEANNEEDAEAQAIEDVIEDTGNVAFMSCEDRSIVEIQEKVDDQIPRRIQNRPRKHSPLASLTGRAAG